MSDIDWNKLGAHFSAYGCMVAVVVIQPDWQWYHIVGLTGAYLFGILLGKWFEAQELN